MIRVLFVTFLALLFIACEKETRVKYYVENQSSSAVTLNGNDIIHSVELSRSIGISEKSEISSWIKRGKQTDFFEPVSIFGDDLLIVNTDGDTLKKDYKLLSNWTSSVDDDRSVANHSYILVLFDSDFE